MVSRGCLALRLGLVAIYACAGLRGYTGAGYAEALPTEDEPGYYSEAGAGFKSLTGGMGQEC